MSPWKIIQPRSHQSSLHLGTAVKLRASLPQDRGTVRAETVLAKHGQGSAVHSSILPTVSCPHILSYPGCGHTPASTKDSPPPTLLPARHDSRRSCSSWRNEIERSLHRVGGLAHPTPPFLRAPQPSPLLLTPASLPVPGLPSQFPSKGAFFPLLVTRKVRICSYY